MKAWRMRTVECLGVALFAIGVFATAACGGGSSDSGGSETEDAVVTSTEAAAADDGEGGGSSGGSAEMGTQSDLSELAERIEAATAVPEFTFDGSPIDATQIAAGKSAFDIPFTTTLEYEAEIAAAMKQAADAVGLDFTIIETSGPDSWAQAMDNSVSQGADLIHLSSANPTAVEPQIANALDSGSDVVSSHFWDSSQTDLGDATPLTAWNGMDYVTPARLLADWVIVDSGGEANVLVIGESEFTFNEPVIAAIEEEFKTYCEQCTYKIIGVPLADWTTKIPTEVTTAIQTEQINYVIPYIDGMIPGVLDGIRQANAVGGVKIASYGATPFAIDLVAEGEVAFDCGYSVEWTGYAFLDQVLRVLGGESTDPDHNLEIGLRCFDSSNATEAGSPAKAGEGFGDAYVSGYKDLWGVS